jgi:hypothetical protein
MLRPFVRPSSGISIQKCQKGRCNKINPRAPWLQSPFFLHCVCVYIYIYIKYKTQIILILSTNLRLSSATVTVRSWTVLCFVCCTWRGVTSFNFPFWISIWKLWATIWSEVVITCGHLGCDRQWTCWQSTCRARVVLECCTFYCVLLCILRWFDYFLLSQNKYKFFCKGFVSLPFWTKRKVSMIGSMGPNEFPVSLGEFQFWYTKDWRCSL